MIEDPIDGQNVLTYGLVCFDHGHVGWVDRVSCHVFFGGVVAMKQVSEAGERGSDADDWTGGEVEDGVKRDQAVHVVGHGVDFLEVHVGFELEEYDVFDGHLISWRRMNWEKLEWKIQLLLVISVTQVNLLLTHIPLERSTY
ncbi:hypothetical protein CFOL_v3_35740 [Cephalotus follicularis]|uniref:Uncharacterized protein n=1 Tax=Cephalotus follicularis TaxID=3775 RepID=A0A1Q3DIS4_CEPFO|nr:hypothetical protein CFOL_v3_35740 [Cephalotus follicularis]